jgi:hypothetical protein
VTRREGLRGHLLAQLDTLEVVRLDPHPRGDLDETETHGLAGGPEHAAHRGGAALQLGQVTLYSRPWSKPSRWAWACSSAAVTRQTKGSSHLAEHLASARSRRT